MAFEDLGATCYFMRGSDHCFFIIIFIDQSESLERAALMTSAGHLARSTGAKCVTAAHEHY